MNQHRTDLSRWSLVLALLILPLVLYWPFILGGKALFWGTPLLQFWPWRQFAAEQLHAGRIPLWNPYAGNGVPLLADHQSAIFYPPNVIFWLLPVHYAMGLSLALHAMLAGGAMVALARDLGLSRFAGLIAALAFMFSGYMVARGSFLTEISALPWLPLIWLFTRRVICTHRVVCTRRVVQRRRLSDVAWLALAIAMQFLAGHAQTWFYSLWSMGAYVLWLGIKLQVADRKSDAARGKGSRLTPHASRLTHLTQFVSRNRQFIVTMCILLLAVLWAMALSMAQFLPTLELSRLAGRAGREEWESYSLQYSFWPWRLLTLLAPDFFGNPVQGNYWGYATYWEDAGYIGLLPVVFVILAVNAWFRRRKQADCSAALRETPFWAVLALVALILAMGKNMPLYMLLYRYVPGFAMFQAPARLLCLYTPAVALLAGIGVDALLPSEAFAKKAARWLVGGGGILLASGAAFLILPGVEATFISATARMALLLVLSLLLLLWGNAMRPGHRHRRYWQWIVAGFVAVDLIWAGYALNPAVDAGLYRSQTNTGAFLRTDDQGRMVYLPGTRQALMFERYLDFADYGPPEIDRWWPMREDLAPDLGMVEHIPSANSFEPLLEEHYYALMQAVGEMPHDLALRTLGLMNVAYILDPADDWPEERIYRAATVNVYRNPYLLPRAYVVYEAYWVSDDGEALAALAAPDFDPARQVVLVDSAHSTLSDSIPPAADVGPAPVPVILPSGPNQVKISTKMPLPGYLVLADTYYPGWRATVDGDRIQILRANTAFRALRLDAGEHEIVFEYRPVSFTAGWVCSLIAFGAAVVVGIKVLLDRRAGSR
ncbi:MAG: YfhO family protein [Anaerolineae bacterium]|nr:YfhO family protein [Anaerolineae bacterium]